MTVVKQGKKVSACEKCGNDSYYTKTRVTGYVYSWYNLDGVTIECSSQMYDGLRYASSKFLKCYCAECHFYLGKKEDL